MPSCGIGLDIGLAEDTAQEDTKEFAAALYNG